MRYTGRTLGVMLLALLGMALPPQWIFAQVSKPAPAVARSGDAVLARVDGQTIKSSDLERMFKSRHVEPDLQPKVREEFLDQLIDMLVMQKFLKAQKITVADSELDAQVAQIKALLPKSATGQLDLKEHGYTEKILREELALPLMWRNYLSQTVTEKQIQQHFELHRVELDGTEVRASQIYFKVADRQDPKQFEQAKARMSKVRAEIKAGLDFAAAARKYSDSPSREKGGDVGLFLTEGKMPRAFTKVAFTLQPGELSDPIVSPFGVHLCLVTDRKPGEASLEDVRPQVMEAISNELHVKKVQELRAKAKIQRP